MSRPMNQMPGFQQGQGQVPQTPLHPTVTYGQPGGQQAVVLPPNAPMPGQQVQTPGAPPQYYGAGYDPSQMPPAPQQQQFQQQQQQGQQPQYGQPAPQQGYVPAAPPAQPGAFGQPQGGQPFQAAPPQPQQQAQPVRLDTVLDGPGVPPELRGRRLGDALQIYNTLATDWVKRQAQGGQQFQQQPQAQQPQQQQQQNPQQQQRNGFFEDFRGVVREELGTMLGPVMQQSAQQGIQGARNQAAQQVQDFQMLEADVLQYVTGLPPQALANPDTWLSAADMARGKMIREGRYNPQAQQPQQQQAQQPMNRSVPAGMSAIPQYQFFSEQPTPPQQGQGGMGNFGLSNDELWAAQTMRMSPESYAAWKGGVTRR